MVGALLAFARLVSHRRLKATICLLTLLAVAASGCGASRAGSNTRLPSRDGDGDIDSFDQGRYDVDNDTHATFGPLAGATELATITKLVTRYYGDAAVDDGERACALLDPLVAEGLVEQSHLREGSGSPGEDTCPEVVSKLFKQRHRELVHDLALPRVAWVQTKRDRAIALVRFGAERERLVRVRRTHGIWKMDALIDSGPL